MKRHDRDKPARLARENSSSRRGCRYQRLRRPVVGSTKLIFSSSSIRERSFRFSTRSSLFFRVSVLLFSTSHSKRKLFSSKFSSARPPSPSSMIVSCPSPAQVVLHDYR